MFLPQYADIRAYYGDIHNHCDVSYGKGSLEDAFHNARQQLDFASVTVHAHWPDIPTDDPRLDYLIEYHARGFESALEKWNYYQRVTDSAQQEGMFVTLPSFEWHSMAYGDHVVYFKDTADSRIIPAEDLAQMRAALRALNAQGIETFLIPHHIGYRTGYRGINWAAFTTEFSPAVEMISFHGLSEHTEAPFPYLHSMGPRDGRSTIQYGLAKGHIFGFIGSTDHHSAHPGHYGYGQLGVWAKALTRDAIWEAIAARRTYALSGDRIHLEVALNGSLMGSVLPATPVRKLDVAVIGGGAIEVVEILHNNRVIERWHPSTATVKPAQYKIFVEVGWGEEPSSTDWELELAVEQGQLMEVEPRLRGHGIEPPPPDIQNRFVFSHMKRSAPDRVTFTTTTWRNPTPRTSATQGICLTVSGNDSTRISGRVNNRTVNLSLGELRDGARVEYLGGFVTPAVCFHQAVPDTSFSGQFTFEHYSPGTMRDWYYVRVRQQNGHYAWSSPIWVEATT